MIEQSIKNRILQLKKEKDVVILAHYYVDGAVQEIADYVGDSYYLAEQATKVAQENILFCGVIFMGESAKILNPQKKVYMADDSADCPMAHMADIGKIRTIRDEYNDVAVVCYVNSTAEIKAESDVCVTSSNAVQIVRALPNKYIYFIPDYNLAHYISNQVPEKKFIFNDGFCHVHKSIHSNDIKTAAKVHPEALVLAHPECTEDVLELADYIGSTSQIIEFVTKSKNNTFIICTEMGIFFELMQKNPTKKFYSVGHRQFCPNMKKVTLEKVLDKLKNLDRDIDINESLRARAMKPLKRMLEIAGE
ncbi:MAG: quinolinate synthase NadA [Lachnospiraceae bacterium]|nr:quinolinate synthase NadA [Lachnospiraceae bacterium]